MKTKNILITAILTLALPLGAFALSTPVAVGVPSQIDADFYTLTINTATGSKVTVLGGPSFLPPITDGAGNDELDGVIEVMVGLAQEQANVFSISAEMGGEFSDSSQVTINETSAGGGQQQGDTTPPTAPVLDDINNPVKALEYEITGSSEASANIYVEKGGVRVASSQANSNGLFHVMVDLEAGKTNRFNIYAEDAADNKGSATQAVIQAVAPEVSEEAETIEEESFFPDVPTIHGNREAVAYLKEEGFVGGYPDGTFKPSKSVNRAEFIKIIVGALGVNDWEYASNCFPDVKESDWFSGYVCYAKENGIIGGYPDGTFGPANTINLVEASKILVNALAVEKVTPAGSDWYSEYLESLSDLRYLPNTFNSLTQKVNRGEMSEMVWRILEKIGDQGYIRFTELK